MRRILTRFLVVLALLILCGQLTVDFACARLPGEESGCSKLAGGPGTHEDALGVEAPLILQKEPPAKDQTKEITVYVTRTGAKYHRDGCRYLSHSRIPITLKDAKARGYTACKVCRPPKS